MKLTREDRRDLMLLAQKPPVETIHELSPNQKSGTKAKKMKAYIKGTNIIGTVAEQENGVVTKLEIYNPSTRTTEIISVVNDTVIILKGLIVIAQFLRTLWKTISNR